MPKNTNALVREFHGTFRAAIAEEPSITTGFEELRKNLIIEEAAETLLAIMSSDDVEFADGLGDLDYVIEGAAITFGIDLQEGFEYAMESHAKYKYYELIGLLVLGVRHLGQVLTEETRGQEDNEGYDVHTVEALLANLKGNLWTIANQWGIPLGKIIEAIHESNMSKLDADGHPIFREDGKILKGENFFTPTAKIKELLGV
jgi:predicted HAD superfamily Cof-like phosphohydrolase